MSKRFVLEMKKCILKCVHSLSETEEPFPHMSAFLIGNGRDLSSHECFPYRKRKRPLLKSLLY